MSTQTEPEQLPQRIRPPMFTRKHEPPLSVDELREVTERLLHMDDAPGRVSAPAEQVAPQARGGSPIGDALDVEWRGTGPQPQPAPVPVPVPVPETHPYPAPAPEPAPESEPPAAEVFPGWLRGFLVSLIDDAAFGIGEAFAKECPLDRHAASGWCEDCADLFERGGRYARLEELLKDAPDSAAAVRTLLAEGWR